MCPDCYDYEAAVLFNAHAGDLWRRFTTYLPRHLARLAGITRQATAARWSGIRYVKVAEYQARGVVHFHAVIRLDAPGDDCHATPGPRTPPTLLCDAITQAAASRRRHRRPGTTGRHAPAPVRRARLDARPIRAATDCPAPAANCPSRP